MAGILQTSGMSGLTTYAVIRSAGQPWNGSAFEVFNAANWGNYDLAATEQGSSGYYNVAFPAAIAAGKYWVDFHRQAGGSPASDDEVISQGGFVWDGTVEVTGIPTDIFNLTLTELSSGAPSATPTVKAALMLLYMALRNKVTTSGTETKIHNDAGTNITKATISDVGGTFTKEEFGAP